MPALIAYLIALSLLLGGWYGAVNWLSEPAPVIVAKNAPKSAGRHHLRPNTLPQASLSAPSGVAEIEFPFSGTPLEAFHALMDAKAEGKTHYSGCDRMGGDGKCFGHETQ